MKYNQHERLRLGERLQIEWNENDCPDDALVPPLLLQPLIENAVYHGVEPSVGPSLLKVDFLQRGNELAISVENSICTHPPGRHQHGNQMAMENIRERLMLFFDLEARLEIETSADRYRVTVRIPYRQDSSK